MLKHVPYVHLERHLPKVLIKKWSSFQVILTIDISSKKGNALMLHLYWCRWCMGISVVCSCTEQECQ